MAVKETMDHSDPYLTALNSFIYNKGPAKMLTDFVQGIATHVMANIAKQGLKLSPAVYRVLGVGSGQGDSDLRILSAVATAIGSSQTKRPAIHSVIIEPNETLMKEFKTSVSSLPEPLKSLAYVSFEWHQMTFEKFTESFPKIESFDMIHFVASLYYMDAKTSLNRCYQMLSCGGAIFCTVGPEDSFFPKLSRKLNEKVDLGAIHKLYTEVDLVNIAEKNNWKYEELWRTHCTVDISSCFDESSKEGSSLLDFLTHKQEFRTTADKAFYKKVMDFLNEESSTDDYGRKFIKPEITAVVIYK
ncbi:histamine N-methyltransferase-like [Oculina patagonica]